MPIIICLSLITNGVEHLFCAYLTFIYLSSLVKCLLKTLPSCFLSSLIFEFWWFWTYLHTSIHLIHALIVLSSVCGISFYFLKTIGRIEVLIFMKFSLSVYSYMGHAFGVIAKKSLPNSRLQKFLLFSSVSFRVLGFTIQYVIHFNFCIMGETWIQVHFFAHRYTVWIPFLHCTAFALFPQDFISLLPLHFFEKLMLMLVNLFLNS